MLYSDETIRMEKFCEDIVQAVMQGITCYTKFTYLLP